MFLCYVVLNVLLFSVSKPVEKSIGSNGSLVPAPRHRSAVTPTGEATSRSVVPPPRPTALPRPKSDYSVGASEQGSTVVRNQSDTDLERKTDVASTPQSIDQSFEPIQKPAADSSDVADVEDSETAAMPPPTSLPPALPPGFANRGPPPPLLSLIHI